MTDTFDDDATGAHRDRSLRTPDPHGEAALLLVESLIHGLIAKSLLKDVEAIEIIDIAAEVREALADHDNADATTPDTPSALLTVMSDSLRLGLGN